MAIKSSVFVDVVTKTDKSQKNLLKFAATVGVAALAIKGLVAVGKKLVEAYSVQEQAEAKFAAALKATGTEATISTKNFFALASSLQEATLYGDEATIGAASLLQSLAKLSERGLKKLVPLIQDFSTGMKVDLNAAMSLFGKTLGSSTNALTRYGITIDMTGTKEEKLAEIIEQLTVKFGGMARAVADTATGALKQLTHAFGDLKEEGGAAIAEAIKPVVIWLKDVVSRAAASAKELRAINAALKDISEGKKVDAQTELLVVAAQLKRVKSIDEITEAQKMAVEGSEAVTKARHKEIAELENQQRMLVLGMQWTAKAAYYETEAAEKAAKELEIELTAREKLAAMYEIDYQESHSASEKKLDLIKKDLLRLNIQKKSVEEYGEAWKAIEKVVLELLEDEREIKKGIAAEEASLAEERRKASAENIANIKASVTTEREARLAGLQKQADDYKDTVDKFNLLRLSDEEKEIESIQRLADVFLEAGINKIEVAEWIAKTIAEINETYAKKEAYVLTQREQMFANFTQREAEVWGEFMTKLVLSSENAGEAFKNAFKTAISSAILYLAELVFAQALAAFAAQRYGKGIALTVAGGAITGVAAGVQSFDKGGVLKEPVIGVGKSGQKYSFAEHGPEEFRPIGQASRGVVFDVHGNTFVGAGGLRKFAIEMRREFDSITVLGL